MFLVRSPPPLSCRRPPTIDGAAVWARLFLQGRRCDNDGGGPPGGPRGGRRVATALLSLIEGKCKCQPRLKRKSPLVSDAARNELWQMEEKLCQLRFTEARPEEGKNTRGRRGTRRGEDNKDGIVTVTCHYKKNNGSYIQIKSLLIFF